jgi:hypothetical protein
MRRLKALALLAVAVALLCAPAIALAQDAAPTDTPSTHVRLWLAVLMAVAWPAFTGTINSLFVKYTPADVDAWAERNPHVAFVAALFRRAGFEPIALLEDVKAWAKKDPPAPRFGNAAMGKRRGYFEARVAVLLGGIALGLFGASVACGLLQGPVAPAAEKLEQCEEQVARDNPAVDFETFVLRSLPCVGDAAELVVDVVEAILASKDPAVAQYKPEAAAAKADPSKIRALVARAKAVRR